MIRKVYQAGFSLIETMIASAMTGVIVLGASTVMTGTVGSQKKADIQSLIDREFAGGAQIGANASLLREIVNPGSLGDCLTKDQNTGCDSHSSDWIPYPTGPRVYAVGTRDYGFNSLFNLLGPCAEGDSRCLVKRRMYYRWSCRPEECTGVETKITVEPLQRERNSFRARETIVKLDRRQLVTRDELSFTCTNTNDRSLTSIDYGQANAACTVKPQTNCPNMPGKAYNPFAADPVGANCSEGLNSSCLYGYDYTGYFRDGYHCKVVEPNGPPQILPETTGPVNWTSNAAPPPTANNPSTSFQTVVDTFVTTITTTYTATAPPPGCDMTTHTLYEYYNPGIAGYYYPLSRDTTAEAQGYALTGETMTVFTNDCPIRPRAKISDCFYSTGMVGYHYLSSDDNCMLGGAPNASAFGWSERTSGPEYPVVVHRYDLGNTRKTTIGPNPGGFTHAGDMGYIPAGSVPARVCTEGDTRPGSDCGDGTYSLEMCSGNAWVNAGGCTSGGGSNDGGGDGGN